MPLWVENEIVANRAIDIWEDFVQLMKVFVAKAPRKQPKDNISYNNLKAYHTNPLIVIYLHLFRDVAARLNCFLIKFQTDGPMVPFLSEEMGGILRWLLGFFIKKEVLKAANSMYKLCKLQVSDEGNWKLKTDIKLTTSGGEALKKVPSRLHQGLKGSWVRMLKGMIEKIQERPISYKLVRVSAALDPVNMAILESETEQSLFDKIVAIMYSNKRITAKQEDTAKEQFDNFLQMVVKCNKNAFANFNKKNDRVDEFLGFYVNRKVYPDFWYVCKFIFTLSHGQSAVERGFNVNIQTLADNLQDATLISLRTVYDEILHHGGSVRSFPIDNSLLLSCNSAGTRYKNDLEQKKKESGDKDNSLKRKQLGEELSIIKRKKVEMEGLVKELNADADKFISRADTTEDVVELKKLVAKANSFKDSAKKKKNSIVELESTIENMGVELSALNKK